MYDPQITQIYADKIQVGVAELSLRNLRNLRTEKTAVTSPP